jgi:hypothetical protein
MIDERLTVTFADTTSPYVGDLNASEMNIFNDFQGAGPLITLAPEFILGRGFSLDSKLSLGMLIGRFNLNQEQKVRGDNTSQQEFKFDYLAPSKQTRVQQSITLALNLNWQHTVKSAWLMLAVGYEANYWTNFIRQHRLSNTSIAASTSLSVKGKNVEQRYGDLVAHGLVATLALSF